MASKDKLMFLVNVQSFEIGGDGVSYEG